ncbi:MAG: metal-dependent transcriptional regulator [Acidimicrobiales bacterium]
MVYEAPEYHPAFEEYCETVFELSEDGLEVKQARIADRLDVSRPAVSEMVRKMEREGLLDVDADGHITLTDDGMTLARQVVRRHRLAERFLTDILDLSLAEAHHEAGKWEHVISPVVETALVRVLGNPTTCPHGNPIPGSGYERPTGSTLLGSVDVGGSFVVQRIPEELEFEPGLLEYLEDVGVVPGQIGTVTASSPDGTTTVEVDGRPFGIGPFAGDRIVVTAA